MARAGAHRGNGNLRVGISGDQAPFNVKSRSGELIGFEVELLKMMAQSMGVNVEYVMKPFPELLPALESGDVDIVMSGMESRLIDLLQVQWLERGNWISELP